MIGHRVPFQIHWITFVLLFQDTHKMSSTQEKKDVYVTLTESAGGDEKVKEHVMDVSVSESQKEGCSIPMMILLSGPRLAAAMSWSAQYAAFGPFLENLLPSYIVQLTQFLGPLIGLFVSPIVGVMSDNCTSRFGRRRPYLVFGAVSSAICWTLMGYTREFGEALGDTNTEGTDRQITGFLTIFFYIWASLTVNIFATPAHLILADFAGNRQTTAAAIGQAGFTLGYLIVAIFIFFFGNPAAGTLHGFLMVLSLIMVVTVGLVCIFAKEEQLIVTGPQIPFKIRFKDSMKEMYKGLTSMPSQMLILCVIFFCRCYGATAYHGAKGQFFGIVVNNGTCVGSDTCFPDCSPEQIRYNEGVQVAGGITDIFYGCVGYLVSWCVPILVRKIGAKNVVTVGMLPQVLFVYMAFSTGLAMNQSVVVLSSITQAFIDGTLVPIIIHILGMQNEGDIGMYVGAFNSCDCLGQLMNFGIAAGLVTSSMGYALPILVGGVVSFIGFLVANFFFTVKLHSL